VRTHLAVGVGALTSILLAAPSVQSEGLPVCRVRVLKSTAAAHSTPGGVFKEIESWVDVPHRGCSLAAQELWFIARRLAEPVRERATYRFAYILTADPRTTAHVARRVPVVLKDVCFGWLPERKSDSY
jgi:hypothetical protein